MRAIVTAAMVFSTAVCASAAPNTPVQYPDNSQRFAYGYSGLAWPEIRVQRGRMALIELEAGESLAPTETNSVILDDRVRWVSVASRSGGGKLPDGKMAPVQWSIAVEPAKDADDAWLSINSEQGRRYMLHLIAVGRNDPSANHVVGFYFNHPPRPMPRGHRQAVAVQPKMEWDR